jgi:phosphoglycolate phosphatase
MALAFARQLGLAPSEIAMVGDTLHDLRSARAAGALAIAVLTGPAAIENLAHEADHVLDDVTGLVDWVDQHVAAEGALSAAL